MTTKTKGVCVRCSGPTASLDHSLCGPCVVEALDAALENSCEVKPGEIDYLDDHELPPGPKEIQCGGVVECSPEAFNALVRAGLRQGRSSAPISGRGARWLLLVVVATSALWGVAIWGLR